MLWKTGHSLAKAKMKETGAPIAGELSGHIFFKEGFYGHDDALYCAIRLFNVIHKFGDLSELKKAFPTTYSTPEIRFDVPEEDKFPIIERIQKNMEKEKEADVLAIDGVRVTTDQGWFLIRASNTQNALSIRAESTSEAGFEAMKKELAIQLEKAGAPVPDELID
jgi:phosphomannomutase